MKPIKFVLRSWLHAITCDNIEAQQNRTTSHTSSQPDVGKRMSNTSDLTAVAVSGADRWAKSAAETHNRYFYYGSIPDNCCHGRNQGGSFKANQPHRRSGEEPGSPDRRRIIDEGFSIDAYNLCKSHPLWIRPSKVRWYTRWHKLWRGRRQCLMKTNKGFISKVKGVFMLFKHSHSS